MSFYYELLYNCIMKSPSRSPKLKRHSTRHVSEITAIASEFGNSAKIIVPRSWLGKRVIAFLYNIFQNILSRSKRKLSSESLLSNLIPFVGSGLLGYAMGFALKKIEFLMERPKLIIFHHYKLMVQSQLDSDNYHAYIPKML